MIDASFFLSGDRGTDAQRQQAGMACWGWSGIRGVGVNPHLLWAQVGTETCVVGRVNCPRTHVSLCPREKGCSEEIEHPVSRSLLLNVTFHSKALGLLGDTTDSGTEADREHDDPETVFLPESKKGLENGVSKGHRTSLKRLLLATLGTT